MDFTPIFDDFRLSMMVKLIPDRYSDAYARISVSGWVHGSEKPVPTEVVRAFITMNGDIVVDWLDSYYKTVELVEDFLSEGINILKNNADLQAHKADIQQGKYA